jgi:hypothetical protein
MHQNILKNSSVIKNGTRSGFGRSNLTFGLFSFFSGHLILFNLFLKLFCKFKSLHQVFSVLKTLRSLFSSSRSFNLEHFIFREGINLICLSDINLSELLFSLFEHKFFLSLFSLLVNKYLLLSLSPHSDALVSGYSHKEIPDARYA